MSYRTRLSDQGKRDLRRLPGYIRQRASRIVDNLANDPRPFDAVELREKPNHYRIRLDNWRIIYRIDDENSQVVLLAVRRKTGPETYSDI